MSVQRGLQGFELGAATINAILTLGALVIAGAVSIIVTYPDVAVVPLIVVLGAAAVVLPILFYPFTYTIWFAVELMMEPPTDKDLEAASNRRAATTVGSPSAS
jgi:hypothetical protein